MASTIAGLVGICIALSVQRILLFGLSDQLRAKEYAYRFHALRDELQLMAANGRVETSSLTYEFLMQALNLAIRNAGTMKLRDILRLADQVKERVEKTQFDTITADIARHEASVGELAGRIFFTFAQILIANDVLVCIGIWVHRSIKNSWIVIRPILRLADSIATAVFTVFAPTRVHAVDRARQYQKWAAKLGSC